ncbi:MAG: hypothetical protein MAG581_02411 [Deltaproteobacteria bacterium]|jgi:transcription initiation factor TFIIIB Brf1 subunit/transcription initiation factor TFIIB|nr:hypothetical protein [Deltaproteobacteria bacterium]
MTEPAVGIHPQKQENEKSLEEWKRLRRVRRKEGKNLNFGNQNLSLAQMLS